MSGAEKIPVLAIDGPSGSGKGTVGSRAALALGWHFLDSGAVYRVLALALAAAQADGSDPAVLRAIAGELDLCFRPLPDGPPRVILAGRDVTDAARSEACGEQASRLAADPGVREALFAVQRSFRRAPGLVADGRDMGTVVFPDAAVKVFLTASVEARARRRHKQLKDKGLDVNLPELCGAIAERDARDTGRAVSPLTAARDAWVVDTSTMSVDEVVAAVLGRVRNSSGAAS